MKKGFTLIEALFVILTLSIVLGSIFGIAYKAQVSFDEEKRFTEASQQARVATDEITRYIRQAGNDPLKHMKKNGIPGVKREGFQEIRIRTDITGSYHGPGAPTGDPDGKLDSPLEDVTIRCVGRQVQLMDRVASPGNWQILADNIEKFELVFLDSAGGPPATDFDIAAVDVLMAAQSPSRGANRINTVRYRSHVFVRSKTFDVFATP